MNDQERILELLVDWEEHRSQGQSVSVEELAPQESHLWDELRKRIQKRQKLAVLLSDPESTLTMGTEKRSVGSISLPEIEGFEILNVIGSGGMGIVYKARQHGLNRLVAVKMLHTGANDPQQFSRIRAEAEAVAQLQHPHIVQIFEIGESQGRPYLALEYVDGQPLSDKLDGNPIPPDHAAYLLLSIAEAVQHAHSKGIVHRDLKPGNILMSPSTGATPSDSANHSVSLSSFRSPLSEIPKITDFGLAKRLDDDRGQTQTGTVLGTPSYMAPEQAEGRIRDIGAHTDVYALGAMLYEFLTGRPPLKGSNLLETLEQIRTHAPVPPKSLNPIIPKDLEVICLKCLEKNPYQRFPSAQALAEDLRRFLSGDPILAKSATIFDILAKAINYSPYYESLQNWGRLLLSFSPFPFFIHLIVYLVWRDDPNYPFIMVPVTGVVFIGLLILALRMTAGGFEGIPISQKRHFVSLWTGHVIGVILVPVVVYQMLPMNDPMELFVVYPIWIILAGITILAFASSAGHLYPIAAAFFLLALLTPVRPAWIPLEVGFLASLNLLIQGLYLRR